MYNNLTVVFIKNTGTLCLHQQVTCEKVQRKEIRDILKALNMEYYSTVCKFHIFL